MGGIGNGDKAITITANNGEQALESLFIFGVGGNPCGKLGLGHVSGVKTGAIRVGRVTKKGVALGKGVPRAEMQVEHIEQQGCILAPAVDDLFANGGVVLAHLAHVDL